MQEDERQRQVMLDRQQREGYTYEWVHTQVQHVAESPTPSNRRSEETVAIIVLYSHVCLSSVFL